MLFVVVVVVVVCVIFIAIVMQMTPKKKKTTAKKGDKRLKMDNSKFRSPQHFERYTQFYLKAPIIQERFVDLVDLKDTFIPSCLQDKG